MVHSAIFRCLAVTYCILTISACAMQSSPKVNIYNQLDLKTRFIDQPSQLMRAAQAGSIDDTRYALEQGDLINAISPEGTAFSIALRKGYASLSTFLLSFGANWQLGFPPGERSALMLASNRAMNNVVNALLTRDVEVNYRDDAGYSALALAAMKGHLTTVKLLIAADANVNVTPDNRSLLMHIVEDENMLISQLLIQAGADVNYRDDDGISALQIARQKGFFDLDLMLVQAGARP